MNIIFAADIFGITHELKALIHEVCDHLNSVNALTYQVVGPYVEDNLSFSDEAQAYTYFVENVGLEKYIQKLSEQITLTSKNTLLIGFSIGGSAIWQLSASSNKNITHALCFYSGQIRHKTAIEPNFPIKLVMPSSEPHFEVKELAQSILHKPNVAIEQSQYLHGFMNKKSTNFNQYAYDEYIIKLRAIIKEVNERQS